MESSQIAPLSMTNKHAAEEWEVSQFPVGLKCMCNEAALPKDTKRSPEQARPTTAQEEVPGRVSLLETPHGVPSFCLTQGYSFMEKAILPHGAMGFLRGFFQPQIQCFHDFGPPAVPSKPRVSWAKRDS